jgi:tetratricopeptide (TPR) repeat protein
VIGTRWLALVCLAALPSVADGQQRAPQRTALKRGLPTIAARPSCAPMPAPRPVTDAQRRSARDLAQKAQQSSILGDRSAARDQLRQAIALDPANADLAYQSARAQESAGALDDAAFEYCRFLSLAPNAPEASEARERVATLAGSAQAKVSEKTLAPFRAGIAAYEAGRMAQAEAGFSSAIALQPDWADAYYDRALTYVARGNRELAVRDLQQYLRFRPEAEDRAAVVARIEGLREGPLSPRAAFTYGLVFPGGGQLYTGRKLVGAAVIGATAGVLLYAVKQDPVQESFQAVGTIPFTDSTYVYTDTRTVLGRPYLKAGVAGLAALMIATAFEASAYARQLNVREQRISASLMPTPDGMAFRVSLR